MMADNTLTMTLSEIEIRMLDDLIDHYKWRFPNIKNVNDATVVNRAIVALHDEIFGGVDLSAGIRSDSPNAPCGVPGVTNG